MSAGQGDQPTNPPRGQSVLRAPQAQSVLRKPTQGTISARTADVVFVIDQSGSMTSVFHHVSDWLTEFVRSADEASGKKLDMRFGFLAANSQRYTRLQEFFTTDAGRFSALAELRTGQDEATLPAIDIAADFPWRRGAHRFIVVLSDEPTSQGFDVEWQLSMIDEMLSKLSAIRAKVRMVAPDCQHFDRLRVLPHFHRTKPATRSAFSDPKFFAALMAEMGGDVSRLSESRDRDAASPAKPDLYRVQDNGIRIIEV